MGAWILLLILSNLPQTYAYNTGCISKIVRAARSHYIPPDPIEVISKNFDAEKIRLLAEDSGGYSTYFLDSVKSPPKPWSIQDLKKMGIPENLHQRYNLQTGELLPNQTKPIFFSSETGREPLRAVRISLTGTELSKELLQDYVNVLDRIPRLELYASYIPSENMKVPQLLQRVLEQSKASVKKRVHFVPVSKNDLTTSFAHDGSKPLIGPDLKTLVPKEHPHVEYQSLLEKYEKANIIKTHESTFFFEGGNVVVGDRHIFTGTDTLERMIEKYKITRANAKKILETEWGKPVIEVGTTKPFNREARRQIDYHADLTLATVINRNTQKETILLGSFKSFLDQVKANPKISFKTYREDDILRKLSDPETLKDLADRELQLDAFEQILKKEGYETVRVPNVIEDSVPIVNYTNIILSNGHVIFPENGIKPMDDAMKNLFIKLGYDPIPVRVPQKSMPLRGGIRCLTETYRQNHVPIPKGNQ